MSKRKLKKCSGCRRNEVRINGKYSTCGDCRNRSNKNRSDAKENVINCKGKLQNGNPCKYKVSKKCNDEYCEKHTNQWSLSEAQKEDPGSHLCASGSNCDPDKPKTKTILPSTYKNKSCKPCLERTAESDRNRRHGISTKNDKLISEKSDTRICPDCPKSNNMHLISNMGGTNNESQYCKKDYNIRRNIEKNRGKRDRKEYESRPEVKARRKKYRIEHPDKTYIYYTSYRARRLKEDPKAYRDRQALYAKKFRKNNPDKVKENELKRKTNVYYAYAYYRRVADLRGYKFKLTQDIFCDLVTTNCYYCDFFSDDCMNGVDRLDNSIGYTESNSVPCCEMCNMMKNTLNESTFILMCAHIATYNELTTKGNLYPKVFNNHKKVSYAGYRLCAKSRKIRFRISIDEFNNIISRKKCYICGKKNNKSHKNGIDRKNNDMCYKYDNCELCCGDCNFLKKKLDYDMFLNHCKKITKYKCNELDDLCEIWTPSSFIEKNVNKLSDAERKKKRKLKEKIRHEKTMSTKDNESIMIKATEIRKAYELNKSDTNKKNIYSGSKTLKKVKTNKKNKKVKTNQKNK